MSIRDRFRARDSTLVRVRAEKRLIGDLMRGHLSRLRPGIWMLLAPRVARHWHAGRVPRFLAETKLRRREVGVAAWRERLLFWITLPLFIRVPSSDGTASILLPAKGGGVILMDPEKAVVVRVGAPPGDFEKAARIRTMMLPHVASAAFHVVERGTVVKEQLIDGRSLPHLSLGARTSTWRRLTQGYARLAEAAAGGCSREIIASALGNIDQCDIPADLGALIRAHRAELVRWAESRPLVPAHGDLGPSNLVVASDGKPILIDFESRCVGFLPFFHDPLFLPIREAKRARPDLLRRIMAGDEEESLACLWRAAGIPWQAGELEYALLAVVMVHVYRRGQHAAAPDYVRAGDHLRYTWTPLAPYFQRPRSRV